MKTVKNIAFVLALIYSVLATIYIAKYSEKKEAKNEMEVTSSISQENGHWYIVRTSKTHDPNCDAQEHLNH